MLRRVLPAGMLALSAVMLSACPTPPAGIAEGEGEGEEGGGEGEGEGEPVGDGDCPVVEGANSICDVQDAASDNAVATGALVTLPGVVATSPAFGSSFQNGQPTRFNLFVGDDPTKTRGGVFVSWLATANLPTDIAVGDVLTVTGQVSEFTLAPDQVGGTETRIDATAITKDDGNTPLVPLAVTEADLRGANAEDYEGVLVRISGGEVASTDQFGFTLAGGLKIANAIFDYPGIIGETFTSITGVVRFDIFAGNGMELMPRGAGDVVSLARPTRTVTELNDGTLTRCPGDAQFNQCVVNVRAIVTSPAFFINNNDQARGPLFGFFIGDPENVVNGRFGPNSGVFVTINPENTSEPVALSGYTFEQQDTFPFDFLKGAAPQPGDLVEVTGDNSERFGMRNIRFVTSLTKTGTGTLPQPALFGTGGNPTGDLKGGRPAFSDGDFSTGFTPALENVAPSANVEQWEAVLVELKDVTTTTACYAQPFDPNTAVSNDSFARDFGNWLVTGDVEIGTTFRFPQAFGGFFRDDAPNAVPLNQRTCANAGASKCQDSRVQGQAFTSLVGIVDFSFNVHRVSPRSAADIVGPAFVAANTGACPAQ